MKLPEVTIRAAESFGRRPVAATGALARAEAGKGNARANLARTVAAVGERFIKRKEKMEYDAATSDFMNSSLDWQEQYGVKDVLTADEVEGMVPDGAVRLTRESTDAKGNPRTVRRDDIQAWEVYPYMLNKHLDGQMKAVAAGISNNDARTEWMQQMTEYRNKKVLDASMRAARQQQDYEKRSSLARAETAMDSQRYDLAVVEAGKIVDPVLRARTIETIELESERDVYREFIRTNNIEGMQLSLEGLGADSYFDEGKMSAKENNAMQNELRGAMNRLAAAGSAAKKAYKAGIRYRVGQASKAMKNGVVIPDEQLEALAKEAHGLELFTELYTLENARKHAPAVHGIQRIPPAAAGEFINEYVSGEKDQVERENLRDYLQESASTAERRINTDTLQHASDNNLLELPALGSENYYAQMADANKRAMSLYGNTSGFLPDSHAKYLADKITKGTDGERYAFAVQASSELSPGDADSMFKQLNEKGAGNMTVIGDLAARGNEVAAEILVDGARARRDTGQKIMPPKGDLTAGMMPTIGALYPNQPTMKGYMVNAVLDMYAGLSIKDNDYNQGSVDTDRLELAIKTVVGNVGTFNGRPIIYGDKDMTDSTFSRWLDRLNPDYITTLGGVEGLDSESVTQYLNDGDYTLEPTPKRGQWLVMDVLGGYLMSKTSGQQFIFKYDETAPTVPRPKRPSRGRR